MIDLLPDRLKAALLDRAKRGRYATLLAFVDMVMNYLMAITFMFLLSYILIAVKRPDQEAAVKRNAEFVIKITWQHDSPDDVDLWVQEPGGAIVFYGNREGATTHLERDDLGLSNDLDPEGKPLLWNEENTVLRGTQNGWYNVSLHYYSKKGDTPDPVVKWELIRAKPLETLASGTADLTMAVREIGVLQFKVEGQKVVEIKKDNVLIATPRATMGPGGPGAGAPQPIIPQAPMQP